MRLSDIIVYGLVVAVIIILLRIVFGSPLVKQVMENFASGGGNNALTNTITACPKGSKFYMFNGRAYCCSGRINADADTPHGSCRPIELSGDVTFCTLGPTHDRVKNCQETKQGLYASRGAKVCPTSKPNYARDEEGGEICCAGGVNASMTGCLSGGDSCNVTGNPNPYAVGPSSCEFQRARESDGTCPVGYGSLTVEGQGTFKGLTLYGCTNSGQICYAQGTITRLQKLGYDTSSLQVCGVTPSS